jgi:hypothetical protein
MCSLVSNHESFFKGYKSPSGSPYSFGELRAKGEDVKIINIIVIKLDLSKWCCFLLKHKVPSSLQFELLVENRSNQS